MRLLPLLLAMTACSPGVPEMASTNLIGARGLNLDPNQLVQDDGSMTVADNIVIDRDGVAEARRGLDNLPEFADSGGCLSLAWYAGTLIAHRGGNILARYVGGVWTDYSGTYQKPDSSNKVKFAQASGNLYFTSILGMYRLDTLAGTPVKAGALKATNAFVLQGTHATLTQPTLTQAGYRAVFGFKDANNNLLLGAPSGRVVSVNATGASIAVTVAALIPTTATTSHFVQFYRTKFSASATADPGEEMRLVHERYLTAPEIAFGEVHFDDITPDAGTLKGAAGYFCDSQESLIAVNEPPPIARDVAQFRGSLLYGNTTGRHRLLLSLLSAGPPHGLQAGDTLTVGGVAFTGLSTFVYPFIDGSFFVHTAGTASQNVANTIAELAVAISSHPTCTVNAYVVSNGSDIAGKLMLEERVIGGSAFTATFSTASKNINIGGMVRVGTTVTVTTASGHVFGVGAVVTIAAVTPDGDFPVGNKVVTAVPIPTSTFEYEETGAADSSITAYTVSRANIANAWTPALPTTGSTTASTSVNDRKVNRVSWSKPDQPEAVPLFLKQDLGRQDAAVLRIIPLRDSVIILKEDGAWRMTGDNAYNFRFEVLDSTALLMARDSAVVLSNQVWGLFNQGVCALSDSSGLQVISRPIEASLLGLHGVNPTYLAAASFGVAYESERKYILFVPTSSNDVTPTQAYVFNTFTSAWTRWPLERTCGLVGTDDKLYLGRNDNIVSQERKTRTSFDYADHVRTTSVTGSSGTSVTVANGTDIVAGMVLWQSDSAYSLVTNAVGTAITVADTLVWAVAPATFYRGVAAVIRYGPNVAGAPDISKQFREATFVSDALPTSFTASFDTEIDTATQSVTVAGSPNTAFGSAPFGTSPWVGQATVQRASTYVPAQMQRATSLYVGLAHSVPFERFSLLGYSLAFRAYGTRGGK